MTRYFTGLLSLCAINGFSQTDVDKTTASQPNVIIVLTDDQGYGDMSCHGNPYVKTPALDKLHAESSRFTNYHVDPTSAPTRSALLTGKYSSRTGIWHTLQGRSIMHKDETTLAQVFQENGYRTGLFGKWHLGDNYPYRPQDRGFQDVLSFSGGGIGQNPDFWRNDYFDDIFYHNGEHKFFKGYCTDVFFDNAEKFVEENNPAKTGKPFLCYLALNAPHFWYFVDSKYTQPYRDKGIPDQLARFYGMIANLDENMNGMLSKLDELQLSENTIFIFMTDNGQSNYQLPTSGEFYYNAGMRGQKATVYEGGHRVPFFIRWPNGKIEAGKDINQLTAVFDVMPTLIDLCGLENKHCIDFDGKSLKPLLLEKKPKWDNRTLFVHNQRIETPVKWRQCAVMTDQYRLIDGKELYNIVKDPSQQVNIAAENPKIISKLRAEYDKWWDHISERFNEYSRLFLGDKHENPIKLTCHDWHSNLSLSVWDQDVIRKREHKNGFWAINIVEDGEYEFTCRTYPKEEDTYLDVVKIKFKIGDQIIDKNCNPKDSEVKIKLPLKAGDSTLQTWFYQADGKEFGAPFVYVEKL